MTKLAETTQVRWIETTFGRLADGRNVIYNTRCYELAPLFTEHTQWVFSKP
jgi:hypothetical protein